jgi:hypothetical protein
MLCKLRVLEFILFTVKFLILLLVYQTCLIKHHFRFTNRISSQPNKPGSQVRTANVLDDLKEAQFWTPRDQVMDF